MPAEPQEIVSNFISLWDGNPFLPEVGARRAASAKELQELSSGDLKTTLRQYLAALLQQTQADRDKEPLWQNGALTFLMAYAQYSIVHGEAWDELFDAELQEWLAPRRWPIREAVAAAQRCHQLLSPLSPKRSIYGSSTRMTAYRASIWAACFGQSLSGAVIHHDLLRRVNVLLLGETGTGKEHVAHILHQASFHKENGVEAGKGQAVNAAAFPETLLESELFGHRKGSFTGADRDKMGLIEEANHGVFFFDEIGDLPPALQPKILRVLEYGKVRRLGETKDRPINVRYVAATHRDLQQMAETNSFRADLFYRFGGFILRTPPLRELAAEDLAAIAESFLEEQHRDAYGFRYMPLLMERHLGYSWPGNMRELRNTVWGLLLRGEGFLLEAQGAYPEAKPVSPEPYPELESCTLTLRQMEDWYCGRILEQHAGNMTSAAKTLGIDPSTLHRRKKR